MVKNILTTFLTRFFIAASNLLIAVLLSNFMGASGRGEQSLIITLISFIIILTGLIGTSSISYLIPRNPLSVLIIPSYLWIIAVIAACSLLLPFLNLVPAAFIRDVCLLSLLLSVLNIHISILVSHQRIRAANFLNFLQTLIIVLILVVSFVLLHSVSIGSYLTALYIGYSVSVVVSLYLIRGYFKDFRMESLQTWMDAVKKLSLLGLYNQIAVFTQLLSFRLSYYILNACSGTGEVGIYSNAVSVAESVWLFGRSIGTVQHAKIVNSRDAAYSVMLTSRLNKVNLAISAFLIVILVFIPESWYLLLFGNEFANLNRIIWTLCPGILFFGVSLILGYYFSSTGKHYVNSIASSAGLVVTLVMGFSLIPSYGSYGAGITASLSYGVTAIITVIFFSRQKH